MSKGALPPPFLLVTLDQTDSTNDEVKRRAAAGAQHGLVVMASSQTAGRGRRGRQWESPPGNLHCSLLIDPGPNPGLAPQLAFVAAVALQSALAELLPAKSIQVKWPNDILCGGHKIAGMLLELASPWVVLGVGVDIAEAPSGVLYPATSLRRHGSGAEPEDVLAGFCHYLLPLYQTWRQEGFPPIRNAWLDRVGGIGCPMTVRPTAEQTVEGRFAGLDEQGALLLDRPDGKRITLVAGDVLFST
ncbi:MAG TPA: biotin--[acetyl-CoA-carboxylase] ligase [Rhodospirillaceae bacterium]|nr:biotin--[acetyl-CoA-carboxylase] ligase [Rhodospirillaceae bacterium]